MKPSIAKRISRVQFITIGVFIILFAGTSYLLTVLIENSLLSQDFEDEIEFIIGEKGHEYHFQHNSKSIIIEYVPHDATALFSKNPLFENLEIGTQIQKKNNGKTYSVATKINEHGVFYHARDLTDLKARERKYLLIDILITLLVLTIAWVISKVTSARVVQQLSLLIDKVESTEIDQSIEKIEDNFPDLETSSLASSFNGFLYELESFVARERTMISLASHELRTPIAVILGAIDVLHKERISDQQKNSALQRIENAANEMNGNVTSLLRLSRKRNNVLDTSQFELAEVVNEVTTDLSTASSQTLNFEIDHQEECLLNSDRVLVKLLLRNLIQNSLQHSNSVTKMTLCSNKFVITDSGKGLPNNLKASLGEQKPDQTLSQSEGLGLYIVTLICERLNWKINLTSNQDEQHFFEITF